ncbi:MAG: alpha-L-fucosidase [Opitutaceae bacterium]|nr:alpha-L-fucosidase [Opitutaceae bacterium]
MLSLPRFLSLSLLASACLLPAASGAPDSPAAPQVGTITNADFETGNIVGWRDWRTKFAKTTEDAQAGKHALVLGPGRARACQEVKIRPNSRYRLSAWVKTDSGSAQVELVASDFGGPKVSVVSALTEYTKVSLEFTSAYVADTLLITIWHPFGTGMGYADSLELEYLGEALPPVVQEFITPVVPEQKSEGGVAQLPPEDMKWFLDAKFGMFVHWGVYSSVDKGNEWVMHNRRHTPEGYRKLAEDPNTGFTAAKFNPAEWAELAKSAGMKYTVLTARHHDGYALFDSKHPNSWNSVQHLGRDLIKEYTDAVRASGLRVGLYYSPMSWRYQGYYNVEGNKMNPNVWGYTAQDWHKENARVMKEEVYEQVTGLLSRYGKIEYMFWDGAWLGQTINHELEDRFWDTGRYQDRNGDWLIDERYVERDPVTNQALGIMGLVRKHQPTMIVNKRFSWVGDVDVDEGSAASTGDIRVQAKEKCLSVQKGGWGHVPGAKVFSFEEVAVFLSDAVVRNINLLLNVAPDREGVIPQNQQEVLRQTGQWLEKVGPAIYNTRGGPWQPLHGEYGFTYAGNKIYCHVYESYRDKAKGTFTTHSIGAKSVSKVTDLYSGKELPWKKNADNTITVEQVDYAQTPYVTILQITLTEDVYAK